MHPLCPPRSAVKIQPRDIAGRWYLCDDGWLGTLMLAVSDDQALTGTFSSERFDEDYRVTARVGVAGPHAVEFTIYEFNWLDEQHYEGHVLTRAAGMLAGRTTWKGTPFGFFATRSTRPSLATYRSGIARGDDFAGGWTAYLDGVLATVTLEYDKESGLLRGLCTGPFGAYDVTGRPGGAEAHAVKLRLDAGEDGHAAAELTGYLMSRPKNAVCGTMTVAGADLGFIMIRYA